jgi:hypothetical protein
MKTLSLVLGILAIIVMIVGFFPCLGSLNWINIPFAAIGLIISIVAVTQSKPDESKGSAVAGIVLCSIAVVFGLIRLIIGGGVA